MVSVSLYSAKIAFLATVLVVFIGAFLASILSRGIVEFPKSKFLLALIAFLAIAFISSIFSGQINKSVAGLVFDLGTSGSLLILVLLTFVSILAVKEKTEVGAKAIYAFLFSSVVVVLHLIVRAFGATYFPASIANRIPNFLVGGSIDSAIFLGITVIASLSVLNSLSLSNRGKYFLYTLLTLSMVFIGAIGFMPIIVVIGLFALVYFVYTLSWSVSAPGEQKKEHASFPSLFVLALSLIFILSGGSVSAFLSNTFKMNMVDVRPNFEVTMNLIGSAWKQNAAFGVGANMFKELWDMKRPVEINVTQFWATDFNFGSGFVPTVAITTGLLGLLSLLVFLVLYIYTGFKAIFFSSTDSSFRYVASTTFFISIFLWAMSIIYTPSVAILALMFVFSGIFIGILFAEGLLQSMRINIFF
jgi:hypothetical protein